MKVNRGLLIISMVIISLLAVGVVSASENVSDVIETADFDEVVAVDDNIEYVNAIDDNSNDLGVVENNTADSEILSVESENVPVTVNVGENDIIKDSSSNNSFDWTTLYGKNSISNNSLTFDLSSLFGKDKGNSIFGGFSLFTCLTLYKIFSTIL